MKIQRHRVDNDRGEWCLSEDVAELEAENETLRGEIERINRCLAEAQADIERLKSDGENERHSDDVAVDDFAKAMKAKMKASREKGRHGWEWANVQYLAAQLIYHVKKGDPVDVANFCMMLHNRGQSGILSHAWAAEVEGKARLKVLSAEEVTEPGWYWLKWGGWSWNIVRVSFYAGEIVVHSGSEVYDSPEDGLFIGPLTPPEG